MGTMTTKKRMASKQYKKAALEQLRDQFFHCAWAKGTFEEWLKEIKDSPSLNKIERDAINDHLSGSD